MPSHFGGGRGVCNQGGSCALPAHTTSSIASFTTPSSFPDFEPDSSNTTTSDSDSDSDSNSNSTSSRVTW
eukprot:CAMPEP_0174361318 /NCGR_PEP_ID=MMETSP0811_2-20130205/58644_1 /TAXON_ID=73025 ORGANISM="Eutreptiella gymnastica-like, Strain CCMP1594" /NCGR_SAMPLE_ID=MMETSP0811_2 /ASSEMBLY_ACC=CAM_ASM_000667 /LENGTH=69 /DNA_ID=CAMNT_0015497853 /DNA_START=658 /DNA_END=864 /DNA_ORIENTATION=-